MSNEALAVTVVVVLTEELKGQILLKLDACPKTYAVLKM